MKLPLSTALPSCYSKLEPGEWRDAKRNTGPAVAGPFSRHLIGRVKACEAIDRDAPLNRPAGLADDDEVIYELTPRRTPRSSWKVALRESPS